MNKVKFSKRYPKLWEQTTAELLTVKDITIKVPLSVGGTNDKENLLICCFSCNHYKRNRDIEGTKKIF